MFVSNLWRPGKYVQIADAVQKTTILCPLELNIVRMYVFQFSNGNF